MKNNGLTVFYTKHLQNHGLLNGLKVSYQVSDCLNFFSHLKHKQHKVESKFSIDFRKVKYIQNIYKMTDSKTGLESSGRPWASIKQNLFH